MLPHPTTEFQCGHETGDDSPGSPSRQGGRRDRERHCYGTPTTRHVGAGELVLNGPRSSTSRALHRQVVALAPQLQASAVDDSSVTEGPFELHGVTLRDDIGRAVAAIVADPQNDADLCWALDHLDTRALLAGRRQPVVEQ